MFVYSMALFLAIGSFACTSASLNRGFASDRNSANPVVLPITPANFSGTEDPAIRSWVSAQNQRTDDYLAGSPVQKALGESLATLFAVNPPMRVSFGNHETYIDARGLVLSTPGQPEQVLVANPTDSSTFMAYAIPSPDGRYVAFATTSITMEGGGGDVSMASVYDLKNQKVLTDAPIRGFMYPYVSVMWDTGSKGLYYPKFPADFPQRRSIAPGENAPAIPVAYHALGTPAANDSVVFQSPEKDQTALWSVRETDSHTLVAYSTLDRIWAYIGTRVAPGEKYHWKALARPDKDVIGDPVAVNGDEMVFRTSKCGNHFCLVSISARSPEHAQVLVPTDPKRVMGKSVGAAQLLFVPYLDDRFHALLRVYDMKGKLQAEFNPADFKLDTQGILTLGSGHSQSSKFYFQYSNITAPFDVFTYDFATKKFAMLPAIKASPLAGARNIHTELRFARSFDGTSVPVWIFTRTDLPQGTKPTFLHVFAYGAIQLNALPTFNPYTLMTLELGGMSVVVSARGGGERGAKWFLEGVNDERMTTVKDVVWATRQVRQWYGLESTPTSLTGGSMGGIHTYVAYVNFPNDFDAFISEVPVSDMPYFIKNYGSLGRSLLDDFGATRDRQGIIKNYDEIMKEVEDWSPYQNVPRLKSAKPLLSAPGHFDFRTRVEQAYFMQSHLLSQFGADAPVFLRDYDIGHSAGSLPDEFAFLSMQFNLKSVLPLVPPQPASARSVDPGQ